MSTQIQYTISIDRNSKSYAVFDGFDIVKPFTTYTDEATAMDDGASWCASRSSLPVEYVYPTISAMKIQTVGRSKRKLNYSSTPIQPKKQMNPPSPEIKLMHKTLQYVRPFSVFLAANAGPTMREDAQEAVRRIDETLIEMDTRYPDFDFYAK